MRQDGSSSEDFRGYLGRVEAGELRVGQEITILPSGVRSSVAEIHVANGIDLDADHQDQRASVGEPVTIRLTDDIDVSRGDLLVDSNRQTWPTLSSHVRADICWLGREPLSLVRKYVLQHTTRTVFARVNNINHVLDVKTLSEAQTAATFHMNDVGQIQLTLQKPIAADHFDECSTTGSFVLIDAVTQQTVAAGMIRGLTH